MSGEEPGTIELCSGNISEMLRKSSMFAMERNIGPELPYLNDGLRLARNLAKTAKYKRAEMPVIEEEDILDLKRECQVLSNHHSVQEVMIPSQYLRPTQSQIYVDKSLTGIADFGVKGTLDFLSSKRLIITGDHHIMDGHHRWLTSFIVTARELPALMIPMGAKKLLETLLGFSDSRHQRNK